MNGGHYDINFMHNIFHIWWWSRSILEVERVHVTECHVFLSIEFIFCEVIYAPPKYCNLAISHSDLHSGT